VASICADPHAGTQRVVAAVAARADRTEGDDRVDPLVANPARTIAVIP
jgi:hypothetical protein